jgi:precorrin-8X/cobalt-precorrin-8 methylmutase
LIFKQEQPPINIAQDISNKSFEIIKQELQTYPQIKNFDDDEIAVITRLIHTSSCFEQVLNNIYFSKNSIFQIQQLLKAKAKIIVDVNMIKVGLNKTYTTKYQNDVICYVNEPFIFEEAKKNNTTRSYQAVIEAIKKYKQEPLIIACGNAPTFIYSAINSLIEYKVDLTKVAFLLFPVGFVNVEESKDYGKKFCDTFNIPSIIMKGRFGSSTMTVATIHAIYKLRASV